MAVQRKQTGNSVPEKKGFKIKDQILNEHQTFPRSKKLKGEGVSIPFTLEQEIEYLKCAMDPIYFAKNYYKITSIDSGFINFDPFPYQEELIRAFHDHRFVIDMQSRQSGKCVSGDTQIWVRKKSTEKSFKISIEEFHALHQEFPLDLNFLANEIGDEFIDRKFVEIFKAFDYEILTDTGWKDIISSNKTVEYEEYVLGTGNDTLKCADDHIVFSDNKQVFVKDLMIGDRVRTIYGDSKIRKIGPTGSKVSMFDLFIDSDDHRYFTNGILSHNTTVVGAYILHFVLFNEHKEVFVLANKEKQAIEILTRIRKALLDLPFFLMPGVVKYGSTEVEFENGCKVVAYATSSDSIRGRSCALLYIDEVAFIENDMEFWESTYPAVCQSTTSKVIMTSTPKGQRGLFYKTWCEAEEDENGVSNGFHRIEVKWDRVPTYANDPTWKEKTVKRLGEARFAQEYGCSFKGSVGTLLSTKSIENMVSTNPKEEPDEWTKIYLKYDPTRRYVAISDVGGGTGGDFSVLRVMDVSSYPYRTAALYRNNEISPMLHPHVIVSLCESYGGCPVLVENNNDMGGQAITVLYYDLEYEGTLKTASDKQKGTGTKIGGKGSKPGIRTNYRVRSVGCSNMKSMIENGFIEVNDLETIYELGNFILLGDKYQADNGCNDDCVMTLVLFSWLAKQEWFQEEFGRNISTDLYHKVITEETFKLPVAGGVMYAGQDNPIEQQTAFGTIPVTENVDFESWAGT